MSHALGALRRPKPAVMSVAIRDLIAIMEPMMKVQTVHGPQAGAGPQLAQTPLAPLPLVTLKVTGLPWQRQRLALSLLMPVLGGTSVGEGRAAVVTGESPGLLSMLLGPHAQIGAGVGKGLVWRVSPQGPFTFGCMSACAGGSTSSSKSAPRTSLRACFMRLWASTTRSIRSSWDRMISGGLSDGRGSTEHAPAVPQAAIAVGVLT
jgi:hypothetical protein